MEYLDYIPMLSLQVFADGGSAGASGDGGTAQGQGVTAGDASQQKTGVKSNPLADVRYGIQEESAPVAEVQTPTVEDPNAEFDKLIKGKYKAQYNAKVQDIIQKRLNGTRDTVDKFNAMQPTIEILSKKYGVDAGNIAALNKAIEDDDSYYEQEAAEKGISVKQLKEIKKMQRENNLLHMQLRNRQQQEIVDRQYAEWARQAEELKQKFPSFDLVEELKNPVFAGAVKAGATIEGAFHGVHYNEIVPAAMQYAARTTESNVANKIATGASRPAENGVGAGSTAVIKSDVSQLSRADREEIIRRVQRGEKIRF